MKQRSLKINMLLNAIKGLLSVAFPLITFPYVSRILGVDEIGRYNFANSIISYFILVAGLGISAYAIREGARFRDDKDRLENFASAMYSINIASTVVAYALLIIVVCVVPKFRNYQSLLAVFSVQIIFNTIGIEWIYSIYEDYLYITLRSIMFQLISLTLLFVFVKTENDVNTYAAITVFSYACSNILNRIHSKKYCKVRITKQINWKKHLKPIMALFAMAVTTTIYVSSDTIILGFLCSDYEVGIYSVSVKIYSIIKSVVASIVTVSIPRMSSIFGSGDKKGFSAVGTDIYNTLLTIMLPAMVGIVVLRKEIVLIVSGIAYEDAASSLAILVIAMFFCLGAYFWGQAVLIPARKEKVVLVATITSASVNVVLNLILIPFGKENAAAFTTLLAEGTAFLICRYDGIKLLEPNGVKNTLGRILTGCAAIVGMSVVFIGFKSHFILYTMLNVSCSAIVYITIEIILKNECISTIWSKICRKA